MADTKVSSLPAYATPQPSDVVPIVDLSGPTSKNVTVAALGSAVLAPAGNVIIPPGSSEIVVRQFVLGSATVLTLRSGCRFRIL